MKMELKGETDPAQVRAMYREFVVGRAADALGEKLRRMGVWLRGLDTGTHYYGAAGHPVLARKYRAERIVTLDGVAYEYGGTFGPAHDFSR